MHVLKFWIMTGFLPEKVFKKLQDKKNAILDIAFDSKSRSEMKMKLSIMHPDIESWMLEGAFTYSQYMSSHSGSTDEELFHQSGLSRSSRDIIMFLEKKMIKEFIAEKLNLC